eukprot:2836428-Pyramimonas_sp.AAC.1
MARPLVRRLARPLGRPAVRPHGTSLGTSLGAPLGMFRGASPWHVPLSIRAGAVDRARIIPSYIFLILTSPAPGRLGSGIGLDRSDLRPCRRKRYPYFPPFLYQRIRGSAPLYSNPIH